ncbi:MAG: SUMF1/EgtB/PvdO family nonheme iron enzyme [Planctomycetota bacterium]
MPILGGCGKICCGVRYLWGRRPDSRVLRGGSWNNRPNNTRSAKRNRNTPDNRNNNTGFRVSSTALRSDSAGTCKSRAIYGSHGRAAV